VATPCTASGSARSRADSGGSFAGRKTETAVQDLPGFVELRIRIVPRQPQALLILENGFVRSFEAAVGGCNLLFDGAGRESNTTPRG